jgi:RNA polymerase sigma factor (sigma-70 family)
MATERELVFGALAGDESAWPELVRRYAPLVWAVARAHRLTQADAADATQETWIALAEHLPELRSPDRLAGWLAKTARHHSLRILDRRRREVPAECFDLEPVPGPEPVALRSSLDQTLWQAFTSLPERCRTLLGLQAHAPDLSYAQLGRALGINVNSIGRTRGRCLELLRRRLAILDVGEEWAR